MESLNIFWFQQCGFTYHVYKILYHTMGSLSSVTRDQHEDIGIPYSYIHLRKSIWKLVEYNVSPLVSYPVQRQMILLVSGK